MAFESLYKLHFLEQDDNFNKLYLNRYHSEATIRFDFDINGNPAFFFFHNEINILLNKIKELNNKVSRVFDALPEIAKEQYIKRSLIDEIVFSNEIEGVISTRKDINSIIEDIKFKDKNKFSRLEGIVNKYSLLGAKNIRIKDSNDIRTLYNESFLKEVILNDPSNQPDGKIFRNGPVFVNSSSGKQLHKGIVPETKLIEFVDKSLTVLNDDNIDILIRVSLFHYLFSFAHPFYDGNGRINRLISSYYISMNQSLIMGYRLSMTIKENLSMYYDAFKHTNDVRNKGDLTTFVYQFLKLVLISYEKTEMYIIERNNEIQYYRNIITKLDLDDKVKKILNILAEIEIFGDFGISMSDLMKKTDMSINTLKKYLNQVRHLDLLKEMTIANSKFYGIVLEKINALKKY